MNNKPNIKFHNTSINGNYIHDKVFNFIDIKTPESISLEFYKPDKELNKTKAKTLNNVFNLHITQAVDRKFMMKVLLHVNNFVRRNENTIAFFGGNLIGVYPIKWTIEDKLKWIIDVLEVDDYDQLVLDIYDLPGIDKVRYVSSDAVNLSFLWVAHQALVSEILSVKDREALAHASINMLQYKLISSIHTRYFKYPANIDIALAVYEGLDNKSQLKKYGSWQGLINARTIDILGVDSLHTKAIRSLETDYDIVKMINDIQSRLKSIFNILTRDFYHIQKTNAKIASTNKFIIIKDEVIIKDHINHYAQIKSFMHEVVPDRNMFVKDDLMHVVLLTINLVYPEQLKQTLFFLSENYSVKTRHFNIPLLIDDVLMFAFSIIRKDKIAIDNIPSVAIKLRGVFRSSRITEPEYKSIKDRSGYIIGEANHRLSEVNLATTRIATLLYIILRALIPK